MIDWQSPGGETTIIGDSQETREVSVTINEWYTEGETFTGFSSFLNEELFNEPTTQIYCNGNKKHKGTSVLLSGSSLIFDVDLAPNSTIEVVYNEAA